MAGSAEFHHNEAARCADAAEEMLAAVIDGPQDPRNPGAGAYLTGAHTFATLALAHRTAEQTAVLADLLGDDSHLDGLKVTLRDISDGFAAGQP